MRGLDGVTELVDAHLKAHLEDTLHEHETDTPVGKIKQYRKWSGQQVMAGHVPLIETICLGTSVLRQLDINDSGVPVVEMGYRMRIFGWVRGDNFEQTTGRRNTLTTGLILTLVGWQQLAPDARIDPSTIVSVASTVERTDPKRQASIAAAYLDVVTKVEETVTIPALGTADSITAAVHPALV